MLFKNVVCILSFCSLVSCDLHATNEQNQTFELVYIHTGKTQCNNDGLSLPQTSETLMNNNITLHSSHCGVITGKYFPSVCGAATNNIYIYSIKTSLTEKAERLGFTRLSTLDSRLNYKIIDCKKDQHVTHHDNEQ